MRWIRCKGLSYLLVLSSLTELAFGAEEEHSAPPASGESGPNVDECIQSHLQGQKEERAGRLLAASSEWRSCQHDSCSPLIREDCESYAQALEPRIPTVRIVGVEGGVSVERLTLEVDDRPPIQLSSGEPLQLDPGTHDMTLKAPSGSVATETVTVEEGEQARVVSIELDPPDEREERPQGTDRPEPDQPDPRTAPDSVSSPTPAQTSSLEQSTVPVQDAPSDPWATGAMIGGGALAATGLVLTVHSFARTESMKGNCAPLCNEKTVANLRSQAIVGDVMMGLGAIGMAYGLVRWSLSTDESKDYAVHFSPTGVAASGSF